MAGTHDSGLRHRVRLMYDSNLSSNHWTRESSVIVGCDVRCHDIKDLHGRIICTDDRGAPYDKKGLDREARFIQHRTLTAVTTQQDLSWRR